MITICSKTGLAKANTQPQFNNSKMQKEKKRNIPSSEVLGFDICPFVNWSNGGKEEEEEKEKEEEKENIYRYK